MRRLLVPLALAVAVALPYLAGVGHNGFVWVDGHEIVGGALIATTPGEVLGAFVGDDGVSGYHRPVYALAHSLDRALFGLEPAGFLATSLALHVACVLLAHALARRAGFGRGAAAAVALLWGLHPVNSAVAGLIHSKADLLATAFGLGALLALDVGTAGGRRRPGLLVLAALLGAAAMLSKETAWLLPVAVAAWARCAAPPRRRALAAAAGAAAALVVAALALRAAGGSEAAPPPAPLLERARTFVPVYVDYLRVLAFPLELSVCDTVTAWSALPPAARLRAGLAVLLVAAVAVQLARRDRGMATWIVAFHVALLPVAQLVPILHFRADRFLYLPSLFFVAAVVRAVELAAGARPLAGWSAHARGTLAAGAVALVALLFAGRVHQRTGEFATDFTLFGPEVQRTPDYREGHSYLAAAYDAAGDWARGEAHGRAALRADPARFSFVDAGAVVGNLGRNLLAQGRAAEALALLDAEGGRARTPDQRALVGYNRAAAAYRLGRHDEALPVLRAWVREHPDDASAHWLLGSCAAAAGRRDEARAAFEGYLRLAPDATDRDAVEAALRALE